MINNSAFLFGGPMARAVIAFVSLAVSSLTMTAGCGRETPLHVGTWKLSEVPGSGWRPELYDSTLVITETRATVEEVFSGQCRVTMAAMPYGAVENGFSIAYPQPGEVTCAPSPCDAVLPSLTGGKAATIGRCPDTMPPSQVLPGFRFRVQDEDHLLVDVPYWLAALPGVIYRRVGSTR